MTPEVANAVLNYAVDCTLAMMFGGGGGFGGYWYCAGCGSPQLGDPPWREIQVRDRCLPCGPGRGYVRCPATHGKTGCNLCRGRGWVEEIG